ncbi:response regulator [Ramlibacter sp.]|uniref:response regulator n=1 Tax=Ramlibacter sp. TaxID=1917967 RepID=UPI002607183E|nr:response regulator [Ramlibacter sp.]MDB5955422.1 sigma-54-dependent Fis family transcriptional regulator [Ramlibacter sp.]
MRILVIDDEPAIRQVIAAPLRRAGHEVELAAGGHEALARLAQGGIELALCDLSMPDMSGIDVLRQARAAGCDASFAMMTAFSAVETAVDALQAGACDYLVKPVRSVELLHKLAQIAELRALRSDNEALRRRLGDSA